MAACVLKTIDSMLCAALEDHRQFAGVYNDVGSDGIRLAFEQRWGRLVSRGSAKVEAALVRAAKVTWDMLMVRFDEHTCGTSFRAVTSHLLPDLDLQHLTTDGAVVRVLAAECAPGWTGDSWREAARARLHAHRRFALVAAHCMDPGCPLEPGQGREERERGHAYSLERLADLRSAVRLTGICTFGTALLEIVAAEEAGRVCGACGLAGETRLCSRCGAAAYCGTQCQRSHYPAHKPACRALAALREDCLRGTGQAGRAECALFRAMIDVPTSVTAANARELGQLLTVRTAISDPGLLAALREVSRGRPS
jgi:hypothetical protein